MERRGWRSKWRADGRFTRRARPWYEKGRGLSIVEARIGHWDPWVWIGGDGDGDGFKGWTVGETLSSKGSGSAIKNLLNPPPYPRPRVSACCHFPRATS